MPEKLNNPINNEYISTVKSNRNRTLTRDKLPEVGLKIDQEIREGCYMPVYRVVDRNELDEIENHDFIVPRKGGIIYFGLSEHDAQSYSSPYLCELVLVGGDKYGHSYEPLMGTHIGWTDTAIPTYRVRKIFDSRHEIEDELHRGLPSFSAIKNHAKLFGIDLLDIFYFVKKNNKLPESMQELDAFYAQEK